MPRFVAAVVHQGAVHVDLFGFRVNAERRAVPQHDIGHLARRQGAGAVADAERARGVLRQPADGALGRNIDVRASRVAHHLRRFLVQALDAFGRIRMHDGAALLGAIDQGDVFLDAVQGLHLEAPPVGPERAANAFGGEAVGDLVGLDAVVEGSDAETEFLRQVEHRCHFVGAITMDVHEDFALEHGHQGFLGEVARRRIALLVAGVVFVPGAHVVLGGDEIGAIAGDIAHARGRRRTLAAVNALGILAAGHLQAPGRAGEFHRLVGVGVNVLDGDAAAADQVRRSRQKLHRGDAAGQRGAEARVLRRDGMFGPDFRRRRAGHLVAVVVRVHARAGIHAEVRMHVDDAGRDPAAGAVHHLGLGRRA